MTKPEYLEYSDEQLESSASDADTVLKCEEMEQTVGLHRGYKAMTTRIACERKVLDEVRTLADVRGALRVTESRLASYTEKLEAATQLETKLHAENIVKRRAIDLAREDIHKFQSTLLSTTDSGTTRVLPQGQPKVCPPMWHSNTGYVLLEERFSPENY